MHGNMILHLIHISGTRMIDCGIDGLSRGITNEGVMAGNHLLDFVPLNKTCLDRNNPFEKFLNTQVPEDAEIIEYDEIEVLPQRPVLPDKPVDEKKNKKTVL